VIGPTLIYKAFSFSFSAMERHISLELLQFVELGDILTTVHKGIAFAREKDVS